MFRYIKWLAYALAFVVGVLSGPYVFAQNQVSPGYGLQVGPFTVTQDEESLAAQTSWIKNGRTAAGAIILDVPQADGTTKTLYITPYEHGLCIEYDGLVEFWTEKFSVHNNFRRGGGKPPEFWVGDPLDMGGFLMQGMQTLRKNSDGTWAIDPATGNPYVDDHWAELVVRSFHPDSETGGGDHGDLRIITRGATRKTEFRGGPKNAEQVYGSIGPAGLVVGDVNVGDAITELSARIAAVQDRLDQLFPPGSSPTGVEIPPKKTGKSFFEVLNEVSAITGTARVLEQAARIRNEQSETTNAFNRLTR